MPAIASWYHCHVEPVKRASGNSSVGLAAYVTGEHLNDERLGPRDRGHPGEVLSWGSTAPKCAAWMAEADNLQLAWNAVERSEKRINSRVCRHANFALSREFSPEDARAVCEQIAQKITDRYGVLATWGVHAPPEHGDQRNLHGHVGFSLRGIGPNGFGKKVRAPDGEQWQRKAEVEWLREVVEVIVNQQLKLIGSNERVTRKSYKERGIAKEATIHLGNNCHQLELNGTKTKLGDINRERTARNEAYEAEIINLAEEKRKRMQTKDPFDDRIQSQQAILEIAESQNEEARRFIVQCQTDKMQGEQEKKEREEDTRRRAAEGDDITDAKGRYLNAAADYYNILRPYSTLAMVVAVEGRDAKREHDQLTRQMEDERDPDKRNLIEMRRDIQYAEYMEITSERLAGMSRVVTGNRDSTQAQLDTQQAREWHDYSDYLRDQRSNLQERGDGKQSTNFYGIEISDAQAEKIAALQRDGEESDLAREASLGRSSGNSR